jgi:CheY-like chemotaxis protein
VAGIVLVVLPNEGGSCVDPFPVAGVFLLAEDTEADVLFFKRAIEKTGTDLPLAVVTDGQQAMDYISGTGAYCDRTLHPAPSVMLLDLKMPRVSGMQVLEWMKEKGLQHPKVIVLTSSEETLDVRRAYELGAIAYIVKPVSLEILEKIVKALFGFWKNPHQGSEATLGWYIRPLA